MSESFPLPALHPAGHPIIAGAALIALLFCMIAWPLGLIGILATLFCLYFFRDPNRTVPVGDGVMVAPADGRVLAVTETVPPAELGMGETPRTRITIFLSVFNVHVNRIVAAGTIRHKLYHAGKFLHAAADKASLDNERLTLVVDLPMAGKDYAQVQIAGLIARRIVCDCSEGQTLATGARYGIIRFGSRADIYLPVGITAQVAVGQTMIGGETILADWQADLPTRSGVTR
jgi:phosphatidylserine decarboxylase